MEAKGFLIFILIFSLFKVAGYLQNVSNRSSNREDFLERVYEDIEGSQKDLPAVVDQNTTLEKIDFDGSTITYSYKLKVSGLSDIDNSKLKSAIRSESIDPICKSSDISKMLNMGIGYRYSYYDLTGKFIGGFMVTRDICNNP